MNINWFKNPDNVSCVDVDVFSDVVSGKTTIENLREKLEEFKQNPIKEGKVIRDKENEYIKLMIPNLTFGQAIENGEKVWACLGEPYGSFCLFWPKERVLCNFNHWFRA
ncbi:hypothetical protein [Aminipila luticellarii]|uniref:Uncharacterized protein n=1 Tax=Aminipila luticellarii TaxID=2507160 RepID=A0A410PU79_9FIRM|nr:hypothetical protein [Aminipila luticellarii]QAT42479.1 hypothetical protein EQM06_04110 [Aminipila luticellarii]